MKTVRYSLLLACLPLLMKAQETKHLSLSEAINLGVENSKQLKLSKAKIDEAIVKYQQTKDNILPQAKIALGYDHAFLLQRQFQIPGSSNTLELPSQTDIFMSTATASQVIFGGLKYYYAKQNATIMQRISELDAEKQKDEVILSVINSYYTLVKISQSEKIIRQSLQEVDDRLAEVQKFEKQGMATANDVLKWKLQRSSVELNQLDVDASRKTVNYTMTILLGLPENTTVETDSVVELDLTMPGARDEFMTNGMSNRREIEIMKNQTAMTIINTKSTRGNYYPTLAATGALYYINPTKKFLPATKTYLLPATIGLHLSYDVASLWNNKHKMNQAKIMEQEAQINETLVMDNIKTEINQNYENYLKAMKKLNVLQVAVDQAGENYRTVGSKYQNYSATTTDKIDAETILYQARLNLEIAKADVKMAYYTLLKSTGKINSK